MKRVPFPILQITAIETKLSRFHPVHHFLPHVTSLIQFCASKLIFIRVPFSSSLCCSFKRFAFLVRQTSFVLMFDATSSVSIPQGTGNVSFYVSALNSIFDQYRFACVMFMLRQALLQLCEMARRKSDRTATGFMEIVDLIFTIPLITSIAICIDLLLEHVNLNENSS